MISDYRRVLYVLVALVALVAYLTSQGAIEAKYTNVAVGYMLLLAICGVIFLVAPLSGSSIIFVAAAFFFFWIYVNMDKTIGLYGTIAAIAYIYWKER